MPIDIQHATKAFRGHLGIGRTVAVDDLSIRVEPGEVFGLLGPNGAGKTTTLKMMLGLLRPDRGSLLLFGRPPTDVSARSRIGFLPENPYFYDYLTAEEFLDFYGRLRGLAGSDRRRRVRDALERVGLGERGRLQLRKMSKGMIQRVGLAQAIQHDPELVILDEPMSGLDPVGRREVRDLILTLRDAGKTVFFSSHILQDAEMLCDRVAIVVAGKLRSLGALQELVSREIRWYEIGVAGVLPDSVPGRCVSSIGGQTLLRVETAGDLPAVLSRIEAAGCQVTSVWPRRDTLEDLFMEEVRRARVDEVRT